MSQPAFSILRISFALLGCAALAIGGMIFTVGPDATGRAFTTALQLVASDTPQLTGLRGPDIDSEMRFYAVLWMAYGGLALWVARSLAQQMNLLRLMLAIFMLGGLGRAVSYIAAGAPHPLFVVLMWTELILPPILLALSFRLESTR